MEISQLRSFIVIAELGSYARASDLLKIPQSTLSRQIRSLEVELRASLFHRHGRGVRLTDRGKRFIDYARSMLHTADTATLAVRGEDAEFTGRLIVGLTPGLGRVVIPDLAPKLKNEFPKASISLMEGLSGALYDATLLGQIDFAVLMGPANSPSLITEALAAEELYFIGPRTQTQGQDTIALDELARLPLILPHSNQWTRPVLEAAAARLGLQLNVIMELDATFATLELVSKGFAYSVVPGNIRRVSSVDKLSWKRIINPKLEAIMSLIKPVSRPRTQLAELAENIVKATIRETLKNSPITDCQ